MTFDASSVAASNSADYIASSGAKSSGMGTVAKAVVVVLLPAVQALPRTVLIKPELVSDPKLERDSIRN